MKKESPFGFLFLRGDMNQDSQVKEYFCENSMWIPGWGLIWLSLSFS